ncbi:MAG: GNAT family protein [Bacteroidota bacterium]
MEFIPITNESQAVSAFENHAEAKAIFMRSQHFYQKIGYSPPWIGYFTKEGDQFVGTAAFKGKPIDQKVEIAYATFEAFQQKGVATRMCQALVAIALRESPDIKITARTLREENYSTKVLRKNGFSLAGTVVDPEDGEVWEWVYGEESN